MSKRRANTGAGSRDRKGEYLQVRLSAEEKDGFEAAAGLSGLALSAWVRERLRRIAREELQAASQPVPFLPKAPAQAGNSRS